MDPYWKAELFHVRSVSIWPTTTKSFSKSFSWGKGLLLYSNNWCCLFLMSFWIRSVLIRDWPSIFPQPRECIHQWSVHSWISITVFNWIKSNKWSNILIPEEGRWAYLQSYPGCVPQSGLGQSNPAPVLRVGARGTCSCKNTGEAAQEVTPRGGFLDGDMGRIACMWEVHTTMNWAAVESSSFWMKESKGEKQERWKWSFCILLEWNLNNGEKKHQNAY